MTFYDRAKNAYSRGDTVRAAFVLAEGLKRTPEHAEALEWLMELYVKELRTTGIEGELIEILSTQANGRVLYEVLENELEEAEAYQKLKALDDARRNAGALPEPSTTASEPATTAPAPVDVADVLRAPERNRQDDDWASFDEGPRAIPAARTRSEAHSSTPDAADQLLSEAVRDTQRAAAPIITPSHRSDDSGHVAVTSRGLSRVLPPLDDDGDDLVDDLDSPEEQLVSEPTRTPVMMMAGAVAVVLLLLAFMVAFFRGYGPAESASGDAPGNGSSMNEVP